MSSKRKTTTKSKAKSKARKVEYDEEDISSEHDSEVEDSEHQQENAADGAGDDGAEDDLADIASIPELPPPEVRIVLYRCVHLCCLCLSVASFFSPESYSRACVRAYISGGAQQRRPAPRRTVRACSVLPRGALKVTFL